MPRHPISLDRQGAGPVMPAADCAFLDLRQQVRAAVVELLDTLDEAPARELAESLAVAFSGAEIPGEPARGPDMTRRPAPNTTPKDLP